jgi:hypothetical protein
LAALFAAYFVSYFEFILDGSFLQVFCPAKIVSQKQNGCLRCGLNRRYIFRVTQPKISYVTHRARFHLVFQRSLGWQLRRNGLGIGHVVRANFGCD